MKKENYRHHHKLTRVERQLPISLQLSPQQHPKSGLMQRRCAARPPLPDLKSAIREMLERQRCFFSAEKDLQTNSTP